MGKKLIVFWMMLSILLSGSAFAKPDGKYPDKPCLKETKDLSLNDNDRQEYYQELKKKIFKCVYKNYSRKERGNVFLDFTVLRDGKIKDVKVDNSKSNASGRLKKMVVESVRQASCFAPFPGALKEYSKMQFNIEISFKNPGE